MFLQQRARRHFMPSLDNTAKNLPNDLSTKASQSLDVRYPGALKVSWEVISRASRLR